MFFHYNVMWVTMFFSFVSNVILSIGRLHKIKGFDLLIDSFSLYLAKNPDAKLLIAGSDDGFSESLQNQIIDLDLTDSVDQHEDGVFKNSTSHLKKHSFIHWCEIMFGFIELIGRFVQSTSSDTGVVGKERCDIDLVFC